MDTKIDDVTLQVEITIPESTSFVKYDIPHLIEEKSKILKDIQDKNSRISEIDEIISRAKSVGVDAALSVVANEGVAINEIQ